MVPIANVAINMFVPAIRITIWAFYHNYRKMSNYYRIVMFSYSPLCPVFGAPLGVTLEPLTSV
jgi:hypothetical protein